MFDRVGGQVATIAPSRPASALRDALLGAAETLSQGPWDTLSHMFGESMFSQDFRRPTEMPKYRFHGVASKLKCRK